MKVATFFALCLAVPIVAALDPARRASGVNVAVCTLPQRTDLRAVSNASRGITFRACPDRPHAGTQLAILSLDPASGLQSQLWDIPGGRFDAYWLKQYLRPQVPGFPVDCWEAPDRGCAKTVPAPRAAVPLAANPSPPPGGLAAPPSDEQLVPLMRRSNGVEDVLFDDF